jgi:hypothetical protein
MTATVGIDASQSGTSGALTSTDAARSVSETSD